MSAQSLADIDLDLANCRAAIIALQGAYTALVAGNLRVKVRFMDRWTEYNPANARALMDLIESFWAQCTDTAGLINISPSARTVRGRPAFARIR